MPKLSIISTLVEAFWLGWSRRRLILVLALIGAIPTALMLVVSLQFPPPTPPPPTAHPDLAQSTAFAGQAMTNALEMGLCALLFVVVGILVTTMSTASLLGVLKSEPADLWPTIRESIREYTWPFIIVSILLTILACVLMIPFSIAIAVFGFSSMKPGSNGPAPDNYVIEFIAMLMGVIYLIFVKYALVNPVIVLENKRPMAALEKSWQMTRGFFWYVLGSYVFLGAGEYGIDSIFQHFDLPNSITVARAIQLLFDSVLQVYWILLAWCMYHRIKTAELPAAASA